MDGTTATVVALRVVPGAASMWDLIVTHVHTFAVGAGRYVVHNCGTVQNDTYIGQKMERRVDDKRLELPDERGAPPTERVTGRPIAIHQLNQNPEWPS